MEKIKYIKFVIIALFIGLGVMSCMDDDWSAPDNETAPFGNNNLEETNVITIAELKSMYSSTLDNQNDTARITDDIQIKVRVTGNDMGGNIYNEIAVADSTGAILICINQSGLFGYLAVGQEILVDLKDLYIGTYGYQAQIGTPYTNSSGRTFPSRMNKTVWQEHFKLIGDPDTSAIEIEEFDVNQMNNSTYRKENCGKLMVVKGVKLTQATGTNTFAPDDEADGGNGVSRVLNGNSNFVVRTSTYADFAANVMPTETLDIVGIFTRYGNYWQILMRTEDDYQLSSSN
ncbi:MAG: DUF5689 domain-containing protein [Prevotellaceae bacterium]|nr:DUF5689 domain-containing protein [Prevotellaceae bacterium]